MFFTEKQNFLESRGRLVAARKGIIRPRGEVSLFGFFYVFVPCLCVSVSSFFIWEWGECFGVGFFLRLGSL